MTPPPFDALQLVRRGWRWMLAGTFLGIGLAALYAFLSPDWFQARLAILATSAPRSSLGSLLGGSLALDMLPPELGGSSADAERIAAVMNSMSVADSAIDKLDLIKHYNVKFRSQARLQLARSCKTKTDRRSSLVILTCEDTDRQMVKDLVEYMGDVSNQVFRRVSRSSASEERKFLEQRVVDARAEKEAAAQKLRAFQEEHRIVDIGEQSRAVIGAMAGLRATLIQQELQLEGMRRYSSADEATVKQLQGQIAVGRAKLRELEAEPPLAADPAPLPDDQPPGKKGEIFPTAMSVPALRFQLEQLLADQKISEAVYFALTQRYEMAKVNEARDTSTFQVMDAPTVPDLKIRPLRKQIVAYGAILGFCAGALWVWGRTRWRWRAAPSGQ